MVCAYAASACIWPTYRSDADLATVACDGVKGKQGIQIGYTMNKSFKFSFNKILLTKNTINVCQNTKVIRSLVYSLKKFLKELP